MFDFLMEEENPRRKSWFGNYSWWKRRTGLEKILLVVSVVIITMLVVLQSVIIKSDGVSRIHRVEDESDTKKKPDPYAVCSHEEVQVCITPICVKAAANVLESMDTSTEPCDDFYKFACGNYIDKSIAPDDKTSTITLDILTHQLQEQLKDVLEESLADYGSTPIKLAKSYYQACMNKNFTEKYGIKVLKDILKRVGGWPVLESEKWKGEYFDWKKLMYKFNKIGFESTSFIELSVGTDLENSSIRHLQLDQPEFEFSKEILMKDNSDKLVEAYFNFMVDVAVELGCNRSVAEVELNDSLQFEIKLAMFSMPKEEKRNISDLHGIMSVTELQESYSDVSWLKFINNLLPSGVQIDPNETLILISTQYVANMIALTNQTPKRVQANYAIWRAIKQQIPYLTRNLQQRQLEYMHAISGVTEKRVEWKECVDEVSKNLPVLTSALYVRKYFPEETKEMVKEIVQYIREELIKTIKSLDWMDEITRKNALDKAEAVVAHIGYPDELLYDSKLEEYYKTLKIHPDQYLKSHLNIQIHSNTFSLRRLHEPVNKTDWIDHSNVVKVDAIYDLLENSITFPVGILQGSLFDKDRPNFMNYPGVGWVIGHELIHGFDNVGKQFDKEGKTVDWWTEETEESYLQKVHCSIYQYDNYAMNGADKNLSSVNTQDEKMANVGGIKLAYLAYKTWVNKNGPEPRLPGLNYSPNQLFWVFGARTWCADYHIRSLDEFRVIEPYSDLEHFAKDFNCSVGSRMNPRHKCSVW